MGRGPEGATAKGGKNRDLQTHSPQRITLKICRTNFFVSVSEICFCVKKGCAHAKYLKGVRGGVLMLVQGSASERARGVRACVAAEGMLQRLIQ